MTSIELRDEIVELLNSEYVSFSVPFEAKGRSAPLTQEELDELRVLEVFVFPGARKSERESRTGFRRTYKPIVALYKKLTGSPEECEQQAGQLVGLAEEIEDALEDEDLAGLSFFGFDEEQDREPYNAEMLQVLGVFATAIVLEYTG